MALKQYNKNTEQWEVKTSLLAPHIKVVDLQGNFETENPTVEDCLIETSEQIKTIRKDVEYIYQNGTIGGGGGGGSKFPTIEIFGEETINIPSMTKYNLNFNFQSSAGGNGNGTLEISGKNTVYKRSLYFVLKQGKNTVEIPELEAGDYELALYGIDRTGMGTNTVFITLNSGLLELKTTLSEVIKSEVGTKNTYRYSINAGNFLFSHKAVIKYSYWDRLGNLIVSTEEFEIDRNARYINYDIGTFSTSGIYKYKIEVSIPTLAIISNSLSFSYVVESPIDIFVDSPLLEDNFFLENASISLPYKVILKNGRFFNINYYYRELGGTALTKVNQEAITIDTTNGNYSYCRIPGLPRLRGEEVTKYEVLMDVYSLDDHDIYLDGENKYIFPHPINIIESDGASFSHKKDNLIVSLDAKTLGRTNEEMAVRHIWPDADNNPNLVELKDFTWETNNGWIPDEESGEIEYVTFNGKAYAEVNLSLLDPSKYNINLYGGFTVEIYHNTKEDGHTEDGGYNCVMDIWKSFGNEHKRGRVNGHGILLDANKVYYKSTGSSDTLGNKYLADEWVHHAFSFNIESGEMCFYVNGILSAIKLIKTPSDRFEIFKKIYLGARINETEQIVDNAKTKIRAFRVYNTPLKDDEICENYFSLLPNSIQKEQYDKLLGDRQIPTVKIKFNKEQLSVLDEVDCEYIKYSYFDENGLPQTDLFAGKISIQGTTSRTYPVQNYTIKLEDENGPKLYAPQKGWIPESIFTLKADYMDSSRNNNTGIANFGTELQKFSISNLDWDPRTPAQKQDTEDLKYKTTIAGFPVKLEIETQVGNTWVTEEIGIYNWNTDRYGSKNYGLELFPDSISYEAGGNLGNATNFTSSEWENIRRDWICRYHKGDSKNAFTERDPNGEAGATMLGGVSHEKFRDLCKWINENAKKSDSDQTFKHQLDKHINVHSALLYMITVETFGLMDNLAKNMVLMNFGTTLIGEQEEYIWYPSLYDLDSSVGLSNDGRLVRPPFVNFNSYNNAPVAGDGNTDSDEFFTTYNGVDSLLWQKIKTAFSSELTELYKQLRLKKFLTLENVLDMYYSQTIDKISANFYNKDMRAKYVNPAKGLSPSLDPGQDYSSYLTFLNGSRKEFTKKWLSDRLNFLDSLYGYGSETVKDGTQGDFFRNFQGRFLLKNINTQEFTLMIKTKTPMLINVTDDKNKPTGAKYFANNDKFYPITYKLSEIISPDAEEGSTTTGDGAYFGLSFGPHITEVSGFNVVELKSLKMEYCEQLQKLNIPNNTEIIALDLSGAYSLKELNVNGCSNLKGSVNFGGRTLEDGTVFKASEQIKKIDVSYTQIQSVILDERGGVLEDLNCERSGITEYKLIKQPYVNELKITGCKELTNIEVNSIPGITSINMAGENLEKFRVDNCINLESLIINTPTKLQTIEDLNDSQRRDYFYLNNCDKLKRVEIKKANNRSFNSLSVSNLKNLETLIVSECSYLDYIYFYNFNEQFPSKLKNLMVDNTGLTHFRFGRADLGNSEAYLDFDRLQSVSYYYGNNCTKIKEIRNVNFGNEYTTWEGKVIGNNTFENNSALTKITTKTGSKLKLGAGSATFRYCRVLTELPALAFLDFSTIASPGEMFRGSGISLTTAHKVMQALTGMTTFGWTFRDCPNIQSTVSSPFPENFFVNNSKIVTISNPFYGTAKFAGVFPAKLYHPLVNLESLDSMFNCGESNMLFTFPEDETKKSAIFEKNVKLRIMVNPLKHIRFITLPNKNLLKNLTKLTQINGLFNDPDTLKNEESGDYFIHPDYLINNKELTNIYSIFGRHVRSGQYTSSGLHNIEGEIPPGLFRENTKVSYAESCFRNMLKISGSVPEDIFSYNVNPSTGIGLLTSANEMFLDCQSLTGVVKDYFAKHKNIVSMRHVFANAFSIGESIENNGLDLNFFRNKPLLQDIYRAFYNAQKMNYKLYDNQFGSDNTKIQASNIRLIDGLFAYNYGFKGDIPEAIFNNINSNGEVVDSQITGASEVFRQSGVTGPIPENLFKGWKKATNLSTFFYFCRGINGGFHKNLFKDLIKVVNLDHFITGEYGQTHYFGTNRNTGVSGEDSVVEGVQYKFNENLFSTCVELQSIKNFLNWRPQLAGDISENIFKYNKKLKITEGMFVGNNGKVLLNSRMFLNCPEIENISSMFEGFTGTIDLRADFVTKENNNQVSSNNLYKFSKMFCSTVDPNGSGATFVTGSTAPSWWLSSQYAGATSTKAFGGLSGKVTNYGEIETAWK